MTYTPPPFPTGIAPGKSSPSAKNLQSALKAAGYMDAGVTLSDTYGPHTVASVKAFHRAHPAYGAATDGAIGPHGWAALFKLAYEEGGTVSEPAADYTRLYYGGHLVNRRTKILLERARQKLALGHELYLIQGSYNTSVSASAGTHSGGGVVDVDPAQSPLGHNAIVSALRQVGFAAWYRTPGEGHWGYHIHAVGIGDARMASSAHGQVYAYFQGRNGLASNGPDTAPASVGRPYPSWAAKYR